MYWGEIAFINYKLEQNINQVRQIRRVAKQIKMNTKFRYASVAYAGINIKY